MGCEPGGLCRDAAPDSCAGKRIQGCEAAPGSCAGELGVPSCPGHGRARHVPGLAPVPLRCRTPPWQLLLYWEPRIIYVLNINVGLHFRACFEVNVCCLCSDTLKVAVLG